MTIMTTMTMKSSITLSHLLIPFILIQFFINSVVLTNAAQPSNTGDFLRTCDIKFPLTSILGPQDGVLKYVDNDGRVITLVNQPNISGIPFGIAVRNASGLFNDIDAPQGDVGDVGAPGVGHDGVNGSVGLVGNQGRVGVNGLSGYGLTFVMTWDSTIPNATAKVKNDFFFVQNQTTGMITGIKMNRASLVQLTSGVKRVDLTASFNLVNEQLNVSGVLASQMNNIKNNNTDQVTGIGWVKLEQLITTVVPSGSVFVPRYIDTLTITNINTDLALDFHYLLISIVPVTNSSVINLMSRLTQDNNAALTFTWVAPEGSVGQPGADNSVVGPPASMQLTTQPEWWNFDKFYSDNTITYTWTLVDYRIPNPTPSTIYTPDETLLSFYSVWSGYSAFILRATITLNATTPSSFALASSITSPAFKTTPFMRITTDVLTPHTGNQNTFTLPPSSFIYPENTDIGIIWHSELSPLETTGYFNVAATFLLFSNALPSIYTTYQANITSLDPVSLHFWNFTGSFIAGGWGHTNDVSNRDSYNNIYGFGSGDYDNYGYDHQSQSTEPDITSYTTVMVDLINNDIVDHNFTVTYISNSTHNFYRTTTLVPTFASVTVDLGIYLTQDILDITVQTLSPPTTSYVCSAFLTAALIPGEHVVVAELVDVLESTVVG